VDYWDPSEHPTRDYRSGQPITLVKTKDGSLPVRNGVTPLYAVWKEIDATIVFSVRGEGELLDSTGTAQSYETTTGNPPVDTTVVWTNEVLRWTGATPTVVIAPHKHYHFVEWLDAETNEAYDFEVNGISYTVDDGKTKTEVTKYISNERPEREDLKNAA